MTEQPQTAPETPQAAPPPATGVSDEVAAAHAGGPTGGITPEQVQEMIDQALERQAAQFRQEQAATVRDITGGIPLPDHAAGVGQTVAETWSLHDQQLAAAGNHPDQQ